jgi:hypothetical protein
VIKTEIEQTSRLIQLYFCVSISNFELHIYLTDQIELLNLLKLYMHVSMYVSVFPQGQFNLKGNFVFDYLAESRCAFVAFADCVQGNHTHTQEKLVISQCVASALESDNS